MAATASNALAETDVESSRHAFGLANPAPTLNEDSALIEFPGNVIVGSRSPTEPESTGTTVVVPDPETFVPQYSAPRDNVVWLPRPTPPPYTFDLRQQWEGVVSDIATDEFTVVLRDTSNPEAPEFDAVLPVEEISPEDLPLLKAGAVLYWTIGYEQTRWGQVKRVSTMRLRRLPAWSKADIERVKQRAREFDTLFDCGAD